MCEITIFSNCNKYLISYYLNKYMCNLRSLLHEVSAAHVILLTEFIESLHPLALRSEAEPKIAVDEVFFKLLVGELSLSLVAAGSRLSVLER